MSSFGQSEAVFKDRVTAAGLDANALKALEDAGLNNLSKFALMVLLGTKMEALFPTKQNFLSHKK